MIVKREGHPCWRLSSEGTDVYLSIQGGMITADFNISGKTVNPYYTLPWWNESASYDYDNLIQMLRGDFFCMPFGGEELEDGSIIYHGEPAHGFWNLKEKISDSEIKFELCNAKGSIEKHIKVKDGLIYHNNTVEGYEEKTSVGYHPMLKLPTDGNKGIVTLSGFGKGFVNKDPFENPAIGGYSRLVPGFEIIDVTAVPCTDGSTADLTMYPPAKGFTDLAMFIDESDTEFAFSAVAVPSEGWLYFQLKNPRKLRNTIMWMSNGGRTYAPWNGRVVGLLGLEEVTAYFAYGKKESIEDNFLSNLGYPTCIELKKDEAFSAPLISGLVAIDTDYSGVELIEPHGDQIIIRGKRGEELRCSCELDFLGS